MAIESRMASQLLMKKLLLRFDSFTRITLVDFHLRMQLVIEADPKVSLDAICEQMGRTPPWAKGLLLRADGYTTPFYKKD